MIETDGDRKFCDECGEYRASTDARWRPCPDGCCEVNDGDLCDSCAGQEEEVTDE